MLGSFGCRIDIKDRRDLILKMPTHLSYMLPAAANAAAGLAPQMPIVDQKTIGSCTSNAGTRSRLWDALRFPKYSKQAASFSRLWLYYQERKLSGAIADDAGAQSRDIYKILTSLGCPPEAEDPYDVSKFSDAAVNDTPALLASAANFKIGAYHRITDFLSAKSCIAIGTPTGYPFTLGFTVYESFERIGPDGKMPLPGQDENIIGGHEVFCSEYEDGTDVFVVDNSWGQDWGLGGKFLMPYKEVQRQLDNGECDIWMGHLGKPW